jgi:Protein of unknown function (DUF4236)
MPLRYQRRIRIAQGVSLNLNKHSISTRPSVVLALVSRSARRELAPRWNGSFVHNLSALPIRDRGNHRNNRDCSGSDFSANLRGGLGRTVKLTRVRTRA